MGKVNQEATVSFAEVSRPVRSSGPQHSSPAFDGRFMVYCQGLKLFIPEDCKCLKRWRSVIIAPTCYTCVHSITKGVVA